MSTNDRTVSYFIFYRGRADDQHAFLRYYREVHVPILLAWPGVREVTLHTPESWSDPFPVRPGEHALVAQIAFDDRAALDRALASEGRQRAREDFTRFPSFSGEVRHQAMVAERFVRKD